MKLSYFYLKLLFYIRVYMLINYLRNYLSNTYRGSLCHLDLLSVIILITEFCKGSIIICLLIIN